MTRISINICTYNRQDRLHLLLNALDQQRLDPDCDWKIDIGLVDNSSDQSARDIAAAYARDGRFPMRYIHEPRKGLAYARNAGLAASVGSADFLMFVDDDEVPSVTWIAEMMSAMKEAGVAAAVGPVTPIFEMPPPTWAVDEEAYSKRLTPEQGAVSDGYTCNAIVRSDVIRQLDLTFDARFNETGGEDTFFFLSLRAGGHRIAWAEGASVLEWVPRQRMRLGWLLQRWYRTGGVEAYLHRANPSAASVRIENGVRGLVRVVGGAAVSLIMLPVGGLRDFSATLSGVRTMCRGAGLIATSFGFSHLEYSSQRYS